MPANYVNETCELPHKSRKPKRFFAKQHLDAAAFLD